MLSANELRIGNLVFDLDGNIYTIANGIDIDGSWKPVEITEEWLLNFGFEKVTFDGILNYYLGLFCIEKIDYLLLERRYGVIIKYVHQLQNLYLALTQNELEIC